MNCSWVHLVLGTVCESWPSTEWLCSHWSQELVFGVKCAQIQAPTPTLKTSLVFNKHWFEASSFFWPPKLNQMLFKGHFLTTAFRAISCIKASIKINTTSLHQHALLFLCKSKLHMCSQSPRSLKPKKKKKKNQHQAEETLIMSRSEWSTVRLFWFSDVCFFCHLVDFTAPHRARRTLQKPSASSYENRGRGTTPALEGGSTRACLPFPVIYRPECGPIGPECSASFTKQLLFFLFSLFSLWAFV